MAIQKLFAGLLATLWFGGFVMADLANEFLEAHNKVRAAVGVPPLKWNPKISSSANLFARYQRDHSHCEMKPSDSKRFGENECWAKGRPISASEAVQTWADQKRFYDYRSNSCIGSGHQRCGVYTQMVWRNSTELGCALVTCDKGDITFVVCNYYPPGNIVGQRPF